MDKRKILEDMITNELTIKQACEKQGCSISTLKKYISELANSQETNETKLYEKYLQVAKNNLQEGRIKGGKKSQRKASLTNEEIKMLFELMINNDYTLRELEEILEKKQKHISKSTLYDLFVHHLEQKDLARLKELFMKHREKSSQEYTTVENEYRFKKY